MPDVLDAVADIHDKLHIDVVFNASKESISSSMTVQSKKLSMGSNKRNFEPVALTSEIPIFIYRYYFDD